MHVKSNFIFCFISELLPRSFMPLHTNQVCPGRDAIIFSIITTSMVQYALVSCIIKVNSKFYSSHCLCVPVSQCAGMRKHLSKHSVTMC